MYCRKIDIHVRKSCMCVEALTLLGLRVYLWNPRYSSVAYTEYFFIVSLTTAAVTGRSGVCGLSVRLSCRCQVHDKRDTFVLSGKLIKLRNWEPDGRETVSCCYLYLCSHKIEHRRPSRNSSCAPCSYLLARLSCMFFTSEHSGVKWKITERCWNNMLEEWNFFLWKRGKWKTAKYKRWFTTQNEKEDTFLEVAAVTRWVPKAL